MSSAVNMVKTGQFPGSGAEKKIVLGFKPVDVKLVNITGLVSVHKNDHMEADKALKEVTAGTKSFAANLVTLEEDGFKVGTDTDLNVAGEIIAYTAHQARNE